MRAKSIPLILQLEMICTQSFIWSITHLSLSRGSTPTISHDLSWSRSPGGGKEVGGRGGGCNEFQAHVLVELLRWRAACDADVSLKFDGLPPLVQLLIQLLISAQPETQMWAMMSLA